MATEPGFSRSPRAAASKATAESAAAICARCLPSIVFSALSGRVSTNVPFDIDTCRSYTARMKASGGRADPSAPYQRSPADEMVSASSSR